MPCALSGVTADCAGMVFCCAAAAPAALGVIGVGGTASCIGFAPSPGRTVMIPPPGVTGAIPAVPAPALPVPVYGIISP